MSSYVARVKKQDTLRISQIIPDAPSLAPPSPPQALEVGAGAAGIDWCITDLSCLFRCSSKVKEREILHVSLIYCLFRLIVA